MGKASDLSHRKIAAVKALVDTENYSNREISRRLNVSETSIRRIKKKIVLGEELSPRRKNTCGRKRIFSPRSERCLRKICHENRFATTKQIKFKLESSGICVSERTVRRTLLQMNFKACRPAHKPRLTAGMKEKRLAWAKNLKNKDLDFWKSVCFSDECTFEILANKHQFVRRRPGEKYHSDCVIQIVKHPVKAMICSVISGKGTGCLYLVKGIMKQDQYKQVLEKRLLPQLQEWFSNEESFVFMQDGAPCHTARTVRSFLLEKNVPVLPWSGNSPDMNPIENVWELIKREIAN